MRVIRLFSIVEHRSVDGIAGAVAEALKSLAMLKPLPLQCLLYSGWAARRLVLDAIRDGGFDAIYVDSIRCYPIIRDIRREFPRLRIVVDFDDLLSRRLRFLVDRKLPLGLGFLRSSVPPLVQRILNFPTIARLVTRYETIVLKRIEKDAVSTSDVVVLVSDVERDALACTLPSTVARRVVAIPPPVQKRDGISTAVERPYRFVFVGSDRQLQNELSIEFLLDKWRTLRPASELHIFGRQYQAWPDTAGVIWHGFVHDLSEAYDTHSLVLVPTFRLGGIKTKILEAWAYGRPGAGQPDELRRYRLGDDYRLNLELEAWGRLIADPERYRDDWAQSAVTGNWLVNAHHTVERFGSSWRDAVIGQYGDGRRTTRASTADARRFAQPRLSRGQTGALSDKLPMRVVP